MVVVVVVVVDVVVDVVVGTVGAGELTKRITDVILKLKLFCI